MRSLFVLLAMAATAVLAPASALPVPATVPGASDGAVVAQYREIEPDPAVAEAEDDDAPSATLDADDAQARCAVRFRSFDPDTGYYTTYGGQQRLCPYLE